MVVTRLLFLLFLLQMEGFARCLDTHCDTHTPTHTHTYIYIYIYIYPGFIIYIYPLDSLKKKKIHLYIFTIFTYYIHDTYMHVLTFTHLYLLAYKLPNLSTNSHIIIFIPQLFHTCITYLPYTNINIYIFR